MTQMQPEPPQDSLVDNEGVNAGSGDDQVDPGPAGDVLSGGRPGDFDPDGIDDADAAQQAGELAGAPGAGAADPNVGDSGQDSGLMDGG